MVSLESCLECMYSCNRNVNCTRLVQSAAPCQRRRAQAIQSYIYLRLQHRLAPAVSLSHRRTHAAARRTHARTHAHTRTHLWAPSLVVHSPQTALRRTLHTCVACRLTSNTNAELPTVQSHAGGPTDGRSTSDAQIQWTSPTKSHMRQGRQLHAAAIPLHTHDSRG